MGHCGDNRKREDCAAAAAVEHVGWNARRKVPERACEVRSERVAVAILKMRISASSLEDSKFDSSSDKAPSTLRTSKVAESCAESVRSSGNQMEGLDWRKQGLVRLGGNGRNITDGVVQWRN